MKIVRLLFLTSSVLDDRSGGGKPQCRC